MLQSPKQPPKCLKITKTSGILIIIKDVFYHVCVYTDAVSYHSLDIDLVPEKLYFLSIAVYDKNACSQCNLTTQTVH